MSFYKKALNLRNDFLGKHLIGGSLGLLNRAESYLFLKDNDEDNNAFNENIELFEKFDTSELENHLYESLEDVSIPVEEFDDEAVSVNKNSNDNAFSINNLEEERFLNDNDFTDLVLEEPVIHETNRSEKNFFFISDKIAEEFSRLNLRKHSYNEFNKILYDNFNFKKSALLVYSPDEELFILKSANGLDGETSQKLKFDIEYNNIYKEVVKKSYMVIIEKGTINGFNKIFSENDLAESDFMIIMPFILSNRVIGFFIGLKLLEGNDLSVELINTIEIICKQNGSLLYNIIQNEK